MTNLRTTLDGLRAALAEAFFSFIGFLPYLAAALLLLFVGWQVARLMRKAAMRLVGSADTLLKRYGRRRAARRSPLSPAVLALVGNVVFWLVILLFVVLAASVARLALFTDWLYEIIAYLPTLLAGGLILLAGYLVSSLVRDVVAAACESAGSRHGELLGLLAQGAIFVAALVIGLAQIGIDVTFLTILFGVVASGLVLALALAFGLGSRVFVSNVIAAHHAREAFSSGQLARIGNIEGQIIEFTPTAVVLATEHGRLSVPAGKFQEQATLIVTADDHE